MVARESFSSDDSSSLCSVDLGLGFGLKPGGLPKTDEDSISADLEILSLFRSPRSPTIEQTECSEAHQNDEQSCKSLTWRNSLQESVEQLKEKAGLHRISKFSLPKRSFSLKLRNRANCESTAQNEDKKARGLRRINSAKGRLEFELKI